MSYRTTIILDEESRQAARELALRCDCSTSEAIRRAIIQQRDQTLGASNERRSERRRALERLIELFDGHDVEAEIASLKDEDAYL